MRWWVRLDARSGRAPVTLSLPAASDRPSESRGCFSNSTSWPCACSRSIVERATCVTYRAVPRVESWSVTRRFSSRENSRTQGIERDVLFLCGDVLMCVCVCVWTKQHVQLQSYFPGSKNLRIEGRRTFLMGDQLVRGLITFLPIVLACKFRNSVIVDKEGDWSRGSLNSFINYSYNAHTWWLAAGAKHDRGKIKVSNVVAHAINIYSFMCMYSETRDADTYL